MKIQMRSLLHLTGVTLLWLVPCTHAANFTLTGVAGGGSTGPNLGGVYTSPYTATIEGVGSNIQVFCDDYADTVNINESWNVVATRLVDLPQTGNASPVMWDTGVTTDSQGYPACPTEISKYTTNDPNTTAKCPGDPNKQVFDYVTAAILIQKQLTYSPSSDEGKYLSFAIWDVFVPTASGSNSLLKPVEKAAIASDLALAQAAAAEYIKNDLWKSQFVGVTIYTASPKNNCAISDPVCPSSLSTPQEFISMAEAPFSAIFALDLFGAVGLLLFLRRRFARMTS